jgi:hypothetical protein
MSLTDDKSIKSGEQLKGAASDDPDAGGSTNWRAVIEIFFWLTALLIAITGALFVAPITSDPDNSICSRNNYDAIHLAAVISHGMDKLLSDPLEYYNAPYLHPDTNHLRGTNSFLGESILALPIRLLAGDRPLLIAALARIVTVILSALFTTLMLRELGVRQSLALAGGALSVLISTNGIFVDRIQSLTNQWLALAVFVCAGVYKGRRAWWRLALLVFALFMLVTSSIYTTVMLLSVVPFLLPLLLTARHAPSSWPKTGILILTVAVAAVITAAAMWPWLTDRWDMGVYAQEEFLAIKNWNSVNLGPLLHSPPEFEGCVIPFLPPVRFDGYYPGHAVVAAFLLVLTLPAAAWFNKKKQRSEQLSASEAGTTYFGIVNAVSRFTMYACGGALGFIGLAWLFGIEPLRLSGTFVDILIWGLVVSWALRLATWSRPWRGDSETISFLGSAALFSAAILYLLSLGSPLEFFIRGPEIAQGIFKLESILIPPLGQIRVVDKFIAITGWFLIVGLTLKLEYLSRRFWKWVPHFTASLLLLLAFAGWISANFETSPWEPMPEGYGLLKNSKGTGGLLELPLTRWNTHVAIFRMAWQREHGRPIVAGLNSQAPPYYEHARGVFNGFPSRECLWLMSRWNVDTVLENVNPKDSERSGLKLPKGVILRDSLDGWLLFDVVNYQPAEDFESDKSADTLSWSLPEVTADDEAARLAGDGSTFYLNSAELDSHTSLDFQIETGRCLTAVMIDYGYALKALIPSSIEVQGYVDGRWEDLTSGNSGSFLRARAADLLLRRKFVRLVIEAKPSQATLFRLRAPRNKWHVAELRVSSR